MNSVRFIDRSQLYLDNHPHVVTKEISPLMDKNGVAKLLWSIVEAAICVPQSGV